MRVLSAPKRMTGLAGFGLEVVEYVEGGLEADEFSEEPDHE
jgi:GTP cyclohydrolase II